MVYRDRPGIYCKVYSGIEKRGFTRKKDTEITKKGKRPGSSTERYMFMGGGTYRAK